MEEDIKRLSDAVEAVNRELAAFMATYDAVRVRAFVNYCEDERNRLTVELTTKLATF